MTNHTDPQTINLTDFDETGVHTVGYRGRIWTYVYTSAVEEVLITPDGRHEDGYVGEGEPNLTGDDLVVWRFIQSYNC